MMRGSGTMSQMHRHVLSSWPRRSCSSRRHGLRQQVVDIGADLGDLGCAANWMRFATEPERDRLRERLVESWA